MRRARWRNLTGYVSSLSRVEGRLSEQVTLITGAAGHLGRAIATAMADRGSRLVLADIDPGALQRVVEGLPGDRATVVHQVDVASEDEIRRLLDVALDRFGHIDVCINNCGVEGPIRLIEDLDLDAVLKLYEVNVFGAVRLMKALIPHFKTQRAGRIVNIASGAGLAGSELMAAYSSSKHALVGLSRSAARELAPYNVPVNAVCPGVIASPMMARIERALEERTGRPASFEHAVPMGRYAEAAEVANLVTYLALDAPLYLTGAAIVIDGALRA
jgi:meso-butanediol dehydrogenase / (S,S)-butanediol dehydrogenase / diacetyl reductase